MLISFPFLPQGRRIVPVSVLTDRSLFFPVEYKTVRKEISLSNKGTFVHKKRVGRELRTEMR